MRLRRCSCHSQLPPYIEVTGQLHAPAALLPGRTDGWVCLRAGLDALEKKLNVLNLPKIEHFLVCVAQSLHQLSYTIFVYE
jgi:hypothetical protein